MAKNYPRLQTTIIFLVCVIIVALFAVHVSSKNKPRTIQDSVAKIETDSNSRKQLANINETEWQKQFFTNEAQKPINLKSTPKPAPKESKNPTLTDQIGQDFFTQFWQIHKAGLESDEKVLNNFSDRFASQVAAAAVPVLYTSSDIHVKSDIGDAAIAAYAKNIIGILKKMPVTDAAIIADKALKAGETSTLKEIDPIISGYKTVLNSLKNTSVPNMFAGSHLNLINAVSTMLFNAEALRKADVDPVRGLAAISIYVQGLQALSNALDDIDKGFSAAGVVFTNGSDRVN